MWDNIVHDGNFYCAYSDEIEHSDLNAGFLITCELSARWEEINELCKFTLKNPWIL